MLLPLLVAGCWVGAGHAKAQLLDEDTLDRAKSATVFVVTSASEQSKGDTPLMSGSGFFVNGSGLLVTNNHVVDPAHGKSDSEKLELAVNLNLLVYRVVRDSGTEDEQTLECELVRANERADLAILQAYDEEHNLAETPDYLRFLPDYRLHKNMKITALGFPGGTRRSGRGGTNPEITVKQGQIVRMPRSPAGRIRMIFTDAQIRQGNSGGAMVNSDGLLVGIPTQSFFGSDLTEGRVDFHGLVPAALTQEFIRGAFELKRIPPHSDVAPFVGILTRDDGTINIPQYNRRDDEDFLLYEGDRYYTDIKTKEIEWDSPLGRFTVPTSHIAYVVNNDEGSYLFLEGGNRIYSEDVSTELIHSLRGGEPMSLALEDVEVIGFRRVDRAFIPPDTEIVSIDARNTRLRLRDVTGKIEFATKLGGVVLELRDIESIQTNEDDEVFILLRDGGKYTGEFSADLLHAKIAATGTPIEFRLNEIERAQIDVFSHRSNTVGGLSLTDVLTGADRDVHTLLQFVQQEDAKSASAKVDSVLASDEFDRFSSFKRDQTTLLHATATLRMGDSKRALKLFRSLLSAKDSNVMSYARACTGVLKHYKGFTYDGEPLSDRETFINAGKTLGEEQIREVRITIKEFGGLEFATKGDYFKVIREVRKHEKALAVAAVFVGEVADNELVRLWSEAISACTKEFLRVQAEISEDSGSGGRRSRRNRGRRGGRGGGGQQQRQRELQNLAEHQEKVVETFVEFRQKSFDYGFIIEDPDMQEHRERVDAQRRRDHDTSRDEDNSGNDEP